MKKLTLLLTMLMMAACTTVEFVRKDQTPEKKAILRYYPQANPKKEAKHREKLNQQARDYCGGQFSITKEYQALEETGGGSGVGVGTGFGIGSGGGMGIMIGGGRRNQEMYQFVEVTCGAAKLAQEAAATPAPTSTPKK